MPNPIVPKPETPSPIIHGLRRYCTGVLVDGQLVTYDFNDKTCSAEIRTGAPSDGNLFVFEDMDSGAGEKLITADLACGDAPEEIEIHTRDLGKLTLLRTVIEWLHDGEGDATHRKVLRMFYTRVRKALSPDGHSGYVATLSTGARYFCKCSVTEGGFSGEAEAQLAYEAHAAPPSPAAQYSASL